jgi:hypothetical protein
MVESVDSARHSVVPFLVALPLALLPVLLLIALVLLVDQLEPEPSGNLVFCFAWGAGSWPWPTSACTAAAPPRGSSRSAGAR